MDFNSCLSNNPYKFPHSLFLPLNAIPTPRFYAGIDFSFWENILHALHIMPEFDLI